MNTINHLPMRQQWKRELFNPSTSLRVKAERSRGFKSETEELPKQLIYPMSTANGRRILGVCHETWKRWEVIALEVPEYKLIQQKMKKLAVKYKGHPPINAYQVWVMGKIGEEFDKMPHGLPKAWMVREAIAISKESFTRKAYEEEQARYTSMALTA